MRKIALLTALVILLVIPISVQAAEPRVIKKSLDAIIRLNHVNKILYAFGVIWLPPPFLQQGGDSLPL